MRDMSWTTEADALPSCLTILQFEKTLEELEELESIRAYDAAKAHQEEAIPF